MVGINTLMKQILWPTYMNRMYQTHGENILNRFKSNDPIRTALGKIDEADMTRAEALGKMTIIGTIPK